MVLIARCLPESPGRQYRARRAVTRSPYGLDGHLYASLKVYVRWHLQACLSLPFNTGTMYVETAELFRIQQSITHCYNRCCTCIQLTLTTLFNDI